MIRLFQTLTGILPILSISVLLSACGGGGSDTDSGNPDETNTEIANPYANGHILVRTTITLSGNAHAVEELSYDFSSRTITQVRTSADSGEQTTLFRRYDPSGLYIQGFSEPDTSPPSPGDGRINLTYDSDMRLVSRSLPRSTVVTNYEYSSENLLNAITGEFENTQFEYDSNGVLIASVNQISGISATYEYNSLNQLVRVLYTQEDNDTQLMFGHTDITYDLNGNLNRVTNINLFGEEIFSYGYEYESTNQAIYNHGIMRLRYTPHELDSSFI